ncbi:putative laccase-9 isoform X2 [Elaeis guineensis]|uniref:putative laccase-9 isoform X2 n=1 Tax=Elaeis guineensis var. tenera TaxID=51953 RepID=UPI003C6D1956
MVLCSPLAVLISAMTRHYSFVIEEASYMRLCHTKKILTVNGQFSGPTIEARKSDTIMGRVYNRAGHGVEQPRNPWSDGPEYVTQCPIQPGTNFTYTILFSEEEGTLWRHAHNDWNRATVIVHPRCGTTFPSLKPYKEIPIILGDQPFGSVEPSHSLAWL